MSDDQSGWVRLKPAERGRIRTPTTPVMSVRRNGQVAWNSIVHEMMGQPAAVYLFFDEERALLGVTPADPKAEGVYPVYNLGGMHYINSGRQLEKAGVAADRVLRRGPQQETTEDGTIFFIEISRRLEAADPLE